MKPLQDKKILQRFFLKSSTHLAQTLTYTKGRMIGADTIYATNANRKFASLNKIKMDFVRKGRTGKHEYHRKQQAAMITKERSTRIKI